MPNYSAKEMLLRMADGGSVASANQSVLDFIKNNPDASVEAIATKINSTGADLGFLADSLGIPRDIADQAYAEAMATNNALLGAEQRILGEIAADPAAWNAANAYNEVLKSGVSVQDALDAGVKQSTIDAVFTSGAPLPVTSYSTPSTVTSAFESAPYAGQSMEQIQTGAQNYVAGLMADGVIDEAERREAQAIATQQGVTFQDMLAAGVDPSILFNVPAAEEEKKTTAAAVVPVPTPFPQTQAEYVPPTVYQPIAPQPDIYAPGEEALDREFRDSPPRTEVTEDVMGTQQLTGFDYRPAAELLSATGSGFSFTPPSVTSRPRSLMNTNTLNRYTQGRSAQDLRQLTGGDQARYDQYSSLLNRTGSYGGGLSRSQLFALMRQQDSLRRAEEGEEEAADTAAVPYSLTGGFTGLTEGDEESRQSNFTTQGYNTELLARDLGTAGGARIVPVFAEGGPVKKPRGFEDGGPADSMTADELTAQLMAMDTQEPRPTDQVQTESRSLLENILSGAKQMPSTVYEYGKDVVQSQSPSAKLLTDIYKVGKTMQTGAADDPVGYALDMAPVTGEIRSGMDVEKFSDLANEARAAGDTEAAKMYEQLVTMSMAGAAPGLGILARGAKRTAKAGAEAATQSARMLDEIAPVAAKAPEAPAPTVYPSEQLRADPVVANDPIAVRFNEQIAADPQAAIEQYKLIPKTKGGKILNADLVRELSPDYLKDRSLAKNVHEPASELNKVMYQQRLANDMGQEGVWVFTGGGAASGKSAGLTDAAEDAADLVMDGTLSNFDKSVGLIDSAADSGKQVKIVYIDRDPQKAITQMLDRAIEEGRPVPLDVFLDGHRDARQSIKKITERYADDPRVDIQLWDNQGGKGEQFQTTIDNLSEMDYDTALKESLEVVDEYYKTGKIDQKLYDAITGDIQPRTSSAEQSVRRSSGAGNTQSGSLQDAQKQLGITEQSQAQWRSTHSGIKQTRVPEVQEAAKQLREGKISTEQYQEIVREFQPIKPLAAVQQMPTLEDIAMALTKDLEKSAGIVGVNVDIPDGTPVASRLDIPAYESYDTWVVSLHDGNKSGGKAIGYGQAAVLNNVEFKSSAKTGLNIAAGETPSGKPASKTTIARVYGSWENRAPEDVRAMAEEIIRTNDPDWVEVGMNPFRHSYFYQKTDGMPVKSAEQVIQVGPLVLAKKPQTIPVESPEHLVKTPQGERYFKHGGSVERVHNDNRKYL